MRKVSQEGNDRSSGPSYLRDESPQPAEPLDFLSGGGEMGALIRSLDWSKTPIGSPSTWSPALRTLVRILLVNRFPMLLWWGPRYVQIYNDAYRPIPGAKHPASMGQTAEECWTEIWDVIGPLIDTPYNGGAATWIEDLELGINRAGFVEETHFTVAYSPVPDETAPLGIGGVLATVHEITEKIVGQRRVTALRDLGAVEARTPREACEKAAVKIAAHSKDIPFVLIYLTGADGSAALAGSAGLEDTPGMTPEVIPLDGTSETWPLHAALESGRMEAVEDLAARFTGAAKGPWAEPPHSAVILPIRSHVSHLPSGFVVAGLSSRLRLDEAYKNFLELATSQIGTAISTAQAYEEERKRAEALAEIDRAKTAFFSNVSHEFRTPLTLMLGPLENLLAKDAALPPEQRQQIEAAHRNSLRLLKLVNSLLDFSRIEAGRSKASFVPTDLCSLTVDLASQFRSAVEAAGLKLNVDCDAFPEPVYVDREMWEQVVLNLLSNAFKFTFEGQISVGLKAIDRAAVLTVADTGTGIPESELAHIFERFHRVKGARGRTYEGTGIGLALVQELVKLHGGVIEVESRVDEGSTFTVKVPFGSAHLPAERVHTASATSTAVRAEAFTGEAMMWLGRDLRPAYGAQAGGHARILIADDNADMREHLYRILWGDYQVRAVADGAAALAAAREQRPDLILSDVMMPSLDGISLLHTLRADESLREIPVILISARAGEEARTEGIAAGADDYLTKPFSAKELTARVATTLNLQRVRREGHEEIERANRRLRERTVQFETLLRHAPFGVLVIDAKFRITHANPTARRSLGDVPDLARRDFGTVIHQLWSKEYADEVVRLVRHTLDTGESYQSAEDVARRKGTGVIEYYQWRVERIPLVEASHGAVCYLQDVSNRVATREAIRELNSHLTLDLVVMTRLQQLSTRLVHANELPSLLEEVVDAAIEITKADKSVLQLVRNGTLRIVHQRGFEPPFLEHFDMVTPGVAACGVALETRQRVVIEDVSTNPVFVGTDDLGVMLQAGVRAVQSTPLFSRSGSLVGILSTHYGEAHRPAGRDLHAIDILARLAADLIERSVQEQELRASEERFRTLAEQVADGIFIADEQGRYTDANAAAPAMLGYTREELLSMSIVDVLMPEERERLPEQYRLLESGGFVRGDWRFRRKDGSALVGEIVGRRLPDGRLQSVVRDVTERKQFEDALRESEERLSLAVHGAGMGTWDVDLRTGDCRWSRQHFEILGYAPDRVEASLEMWRARVHPDDLTKVDEAVECARTSGSRYVSEHRIIRADNGEVRWLSELGQYVFAPTGEPRRFVGISFDVTERKEAETELRQANLDLEQFAYSASHDLQEPLRTVKVFSQLLATRYRQNLDGEAHAFLDNVIAGATRMEGLVHDLLAYSQAGKFEKPAEAQDAGAALQAALADLSGAISDCGARIAVDGLPSLPVHEAHLQQLFLNLVGNAIKYRSPNEVPVVKIAAERLATQWRFAVNDNGIGIAPEYHSRIFGLFKRLHGGNKYSGTGIGLALCQRIVERYGGRIWVNSAPGRGSTFYFTLPA